MKNFWWFIYKPADEREQQLLNNAYYYALSVIWVGMSLFLILLHWLGPSEVSKGRLSFSAVTLLLISYLTGWVTLRKEELSPAAHPRPFPYWQVIAAVAALYLYTIIALILAPQTYFVQTVILSYGTWIILALWIWRNSRHWSTPTRVVATILAPAVVLFLPLGQKRKIGIQLFIAAAASILLFLIPFTAMELIKTAIVEPLYSPSTVWGAENYVLINKLDTDYKVGEYVLFDAGQYSAFGKVSQLENNRLTILAGFGESARIITDVARQDIVGKLIRNYPSLRLIK